MKQSDNYTHAEAFKIMQYKCDNCGRVNLGWNSRDGVTPYTIISPCCGDHHLAVHNVKGMTLSPKYPKSSTISFVFVDRTKEQAQRLAEEFFAKHGKQLMADYPHLRAMGKKELIRTKMEELYDDGKKPHVIPAKEYQESYLGEYPDLGYKFSRKAFNGVTASDEEIRKARIYGKPKTVYHGDFKMAAFVYKGVTYITSVEQVSFDPSND